MRRHERERDEVTRGGAEAVGVMGKVLEGGKGAERALEQFGKSKRVGARYAKAMLFREYGRQGLTLEKLVGVHKELLEGGEGISAAVRLNAVKLAYQVASFMNGGGEAGEKVRDFSQYEDADLVRIVKAVEVREYRDVKAEVDASEGALADG